MDLDSSFLTILESGKGTSQLNTECRLSAWISSLAVSCNVPLHISGWTEREKKLDADLGIYIKDSDVGECFAMALEKPRPGFEVYNLAAREVMFGKPLREALARDFPQYPQLPEGWGKFQMPYVWDKAREHFGWEPKWNYLDKFREKMGRDPVVA